jgi:hypothetical protein
MDGKMCGIETIEADAILSSPHVRIILSLPALFAFSVSPSTYAYLSNI